MIQDYGKNLSFEFRKRLDKDIQIFIISRSGFRDINKYLHSLAPDKVFIVSDSIVASRYGKQVEKVVKNQYPTYLITHIPNEKGKNFKSLEKIIREFFAKGGTSKSCILALGGGVTGNIAGLAASIIYRGISLVHVPTTLLAQLDSAPDVKQSINALTVKNAVGTYKAPDLVLAYPYFLKTLSDREIKSGIAEAIKHGFAQDLKFVEFIVSSDRNKSLSDLSTLEKIIHKTISLKIKHWKETPSKWNESKKIERLTHLGHTTGKILETIDLDYLTHGEAISHGMLIEFYISHLLGHLDRNSIEYANTVLKNLDLLYPLNNSYTTEKIIETLYPNNSKDKPIFAILRKLGDPNTLSTTAYKKTFSEAINWYFKRMKK